jgi:hypothetical protein
MVSPEMTEDIVALGFTNRQSLRQHIYDATSIPYEELTEVEKQNVQKRIDATIAGTVIMADRIPPHRLQYWIDALKPGGKVPILYSPEDLHFVVGGGVEGKSVTGFTYFRQCYTWSSHETRRIED